MRSFHGQVSESLRLGLLLAIALFPPVLQSRAGGCMLKDGIHNGSR